MPVQKDRSLGIAETLLACHHNEIGQIFEDVVEDGLVLIATMQDQEVQWPMQAELYDNTGKLIWRQTVFDNRPPP